MVAKKEINNEVVIFSFVEYVKRFHHYLTMAYNLDDIPFNVSGKSFPKSDEVIIDGHVVKYQFHGRGCSFHWNETEVFYNTDAVSANQIMIGAYGLNRFIESSKLADKAYSFEEITALMESCEEIGVFMARKPNDLGSWHVNEVWYEYFKNGKEYNGEGKSNIDW